MIVLYIAIIAIYSYVLHVHFEFWKFCKEVKDGKH